MKSNEAKMDKSNSSVSEINTTDEKIGQKSIDSETDFDIYFIEGNKFEFKVEISQQCIFEIDRVASGKKIEIK